MSSPDRDQRADVLGPCAGELVGLPGRDGRLAQLADPVGQRRFGLGQLVPLGDEPFPGIA